MQSFFTAVFFGLGIGKLYKLERSELRDHPNLSISSKSGGFVRDFSLTSGIFFCILKISTEKDDNPKALPYLPALPVRCTVIAY